MSCRGCRSVRDPGRVLLTLAPPTKPPTPRLDRGTTSGANCARLATCKTPGVPAGTGAAASGGASLRRRRPSNLTASTKSTSFSTPRWANRYGAPHTH